MFTGIIQDIGTISAWQSHGADCRARIAVNTLPLGRLGIGDSIAVNGVCLTAIELDEKQFSVDISGETLSCTTLGGLRIGSPVNLETALTAGSALGGHMVSGHVDGVGEVLTLADDGRSLRFEFAAPHALARYIAAKGSVCIDGVSLTVNSVDGNRFSVNIIPHTLEKTIFSDYRAGSSVNLEVDIIARYLERLLTVRDNDQ